VVRVRNLYRSILAFGFLSFFFVSSILIVHDTNLHLNSPKSMINDPPLNLRIKLQKNYDTPYLAKKVMVIGDLAYIADGDSGLRIINVSNPANPFEYGFYDTPGYVEGLKIAGDYAFIAEGLTHGLRIINISDPLNPTSISSLVTGWAYDVAGG